MAISTALRRVLRIRELEEEQARLALEFAAAERRHLEQAQAAALERNRRGRSLVAASARSGDLPDRLAGLEESRAAARTERALAPRVARAGSDEALLREEFLAVRVARRQAATLVEAAQVADAVDAARGAQTSMDDWFRNRQHRDTAAWHAEPIDPEANPPAKLS